MGSRLHKPIAYFLPESDYSHAAAKLIKLNEQIDTTKFKTTDFPMFTYSAAALESHKLVVIATVFSPYCANQFAISCVDAEPFTL